MMKRGEQLYIYPPDTSLKPILVVSRTAEECAICWVDALNHFHVIMDGLDNVPSSDFRVLATGAKESTKLFKQMCSKLEKKDSWDFYLELWKEHCGEERAADMKSADKVSYVNTKGGNENGN